MQTSSFSHPKDQQRVTGKRLCSFLSRATDILASYLVFLLILTMPLENEDVQAIAQALQALRPASPDAAPAAISAVSIKLPPFWTARPEVWFRQVEAQFQTRKPVITADLTKFNHVVATLDNVTAEFKAIILSPPTNDKYKYAVLKAALINAFGKTQASKDMELLSLSGLGDRKPSSLLRHMESLNADPKTLLRALFLAQLPMEVRCVLAVSSTTELKTLAKEADAIMEVGSIGFSTTVSLAFTNRHDIQRPVLLPHQVCKEARKCNQQGCKMAYLVSTSASISSSPSPASGNRHAGL